MPQAPARRAVGKSSDVARLVGLHHRRRGWAWVAIGSLIGLVVYVGIDVNLFENLTGRAETFGIIPVFVLIALVPGPAGATPAGATPGGPNPGGVRRTPHPNRGHHGSRVRRPARRGRGS